MPEIDGIDQFEGKIQHSAYWDHDFDLSGKRVAVIGTGATAIQDRSAFGMVYHPDSDRMVAWSGGSDVYTLNPSTFVWTKHATTGAETPGESANAGTYGRFRYVPSKDIFIVVNSIDKNVFVYRLP